MSSPDLCRKDKSLAHSALYPLIFQIDSISLITKVSFYGAGEFIDNIFYFWIHVRER